MNYSVLITSIGSLAAESTLSCLTDIRDHIKVIGTNSTTNSHAIFDCDEAYLVPSTKDTAAFKRSLADILLLTKPDIVFNGRDEELAALAELAEDPRFSSTVFLTPESSHTQVFLDKWETCAFAESHNLPFARSAVNTEASLLLVETAGFPLVAKPRVGGFASRDVWILHTADQVVDACNRGDYVIQEFLGADSVDTLSWDSSRGTPWTWNPVNSCHSFDVLIGRNGELLHHCVTEADRRGSRSTRIRNCSNSPIHDVAKDYARALATTGYRGPVNGQGKLVEGRGFVAFELNARFAGSTPAKQRLGHDLVLKTLRHFVGGIAALQTSSERHAAVSDSIFSTRVYRGARQELMDEFREARVWRAEKQGESQ